MQHSILSMLALPEKTLLVKLWDRNGESDTAALRSYCHRKGIRTDIVLMINAVTKRMIPKLEATDCLGDRCVLSKKLLPHL